MQLSKMDTARDSWNFESRQQIALPTKNRIQYTRHAIHLRNQEGLFYTYTEMHFDFSPAAGYRNE